jgi:hypothetical protein
VVQGDLRALDTLHGHLEEVLRIVLAVERCIVLVEVQMEHRTDGPLEEVLHIGPEKVLEAVARRNGLVRVEVGHTLAELRSLLVTTTNGLVSVAIKTHVEGRQIADVDQVVAGHTLAELQSSSVNA